MINASAEGHRRRSDRDGRWHHRGRAIVYAAEHLSLATLEILVHLGTRDQIQPYVSWEQEIPDALLEAAPAISGAWRDDLESTRKWGARWLTKQAAPAVRVLGFVVPSEFNVLLNPAQAGFNLKWVRTGPSPVVFDPRLLRERE